MEKRCTKCGQQLPEDALFCSMCGQAVEQTHQAQGEVEEIKIAATENQQETETIADGWKQEQPHQTQGKQLREAGQAFQEASQVLVKEVGQAIKEAGTEFYEKCRTAREEQKAEKAGQEEEVLELFLENLEEVYIKRKRNKFRKWMQMIAWIVGIWVLFMLVTDGFSLNVRMSEMSKYPGISVNEAFSKRFTKEHWSKKDIDGDTYYSIFKGYDPATQTDWKVYFKVEDELFSVDKIMIDGTTTTNNFEINTLLEYVYTGSFNTMRANEELDFLLGSLFLMSLFS